MSKNNFFNFLTSNNFRVRIQNLPRHKTVAPFRTFFQSCQFTPFLHSTAELSKMKSTTVLCFAIAILVLPLPVSSKIKSSGKYQQFMFPLIDYMLEFVVSVRYARSVEGIVSAFVSRVFYLI